MNVNDSSSKVKYNGNNFDLKPNNLFEWDDNLEQANASDNNANQGLYSDIENLVLLSRRNNLPRAPDDMASMVEFDLI